MAMKRRLRPGIVGDRRYRNGHSSVGKGLRGCVNTDRAENGPACHENRRRAAFRSRTLR